MSRVRYSHRERGTRGWTLSKRLLITGGAGFIGFHLANYLVKKGYHVCLADNHARGIVDNDLERLVVRTEVTFFNVDLLDSVAVISLGKNYDAIFHLGAIIGVKNVLENPFNVLVDNTRMLENVMQLARKQLNLTRFLFASTSEVYAGTLKHFNLTIPTSENVALTVTDLDHPRTSYMLSKIMGEAIVQHSGLPFVIFRPHNVYGPRMGMAHVIPEQLKKAFKANAGDQLDVYSTEHTRAFCYIDDAVRMLYKMLILDGCIRRTLNLGTEAPEITVRQVVDACISVTGKSLGIRALESAVGSPARRAPDMSLTRKLLNYEARVGLDEGITRTWDWYRKHVFESGGPSAE